MTSNLQSFSVPFDPRVPPVYPKSVISDEFRQQNPPLIIDPASGYVQPEAKWLNYAPDGHFLTGLIDPTRQMMLLSGSGEKDWHGVMQPLPVPEVGATVIYTIITRMFSDGVAVAPNEDYSVNWGLLLGEDLVGAPLTSPLWGVCSQLTRGVGGTVGRCLTAELLNFNAPMVEDGLCLLPLTWFKASVNTVQVTPGVFISSVQFSASADGLLWIQLWWYDGLPNAFRQFLIGERQDIGGGLTTWVDFVRFDPIDPEVGAQRLGEILQLGSV